MTELRLHQRRLRDDLDPFETFLRLKRGEPGVLFDAACSATAPGIGLALFAPYAVVRVDAASDRRGERPLERLRAAMGAARPVEGAAPGRFCGGHAGFLAYDVGRSLERVPATARLASAAPDLWFAAFDRFVEFHPERGGVVAGFVEGLRPGAESPELALDAIERLLERPLDAGDTFTTGPALRSNFDADAYRRAVESVRQHIRLGEVYQVNLAQRFETEFGGRPEALYRKLRRANPAPHAAYVDTGDVAVASSSPEAFLLRTGDEVTTRPIKGTCRRSGDAARDAIAVAALTASRKERSELNMIVDLLRNDLGRVARIGSVQVVDAGTIETFATVFHRVATIRATLAPGTAAVDLLAATFPGGSVTGAPKIAAMGVIEAQERVRRGVFCGSIGWIGANGDLALNIAIRTLVVESSRVHFHVGGGIVHDSEPQAEYDETLAKGVALATALGLPWDPR